MQQQPYLVLEQTLYIYTALELAEKREAYLYRQQLPQMQSH